MKRIETDVVVIGGGMMGCCIAYNLIKRGLATVVLEKNTIGGGESARSTGGVRQQGRKPCEINLAIASSKIFKNLSHELQFDIEYRMNGNLYLAYSQEHLASLDEIVKTQEGIGFYGSKIVNRKKIKELAPRLSLTGIVGGMYSSTDGDVNPILLTHALFLNAKRLGAQIYTHSPIREIHTQNGHVSTVTTDRLEVKTQWIVDAAGLSSRDVSKRVGIDIPVLPLTVDTIVTEQTPPFCKPFIRCTEKMFAFRQTANGNLVFASGDFTRLTSSMSITPESFLSLVSKMTTVLPQLKPISIIRSWTGLRAMTPDSLPIIDKLDTPKGSVLATGFSGHGLAICPGVGRIVVDIILHGKTSLVNLEYFALARFKDLDFEEFKSSLTPALAHKML